MGGEDAILEFSGVTLGWAQGRARLERFSARLPPGTLAVARTGEGRGTPPLADAWDLAHPGVGYPATFKVHEKWVPNDPELHCDFVFLSPELHPRLRAVRSDREVQASDHQPVMIELA